MLRKKKPLWKTFARILEKKIPWDTKPLKEKKRFKKKTLKKKKATMKKKFERRNLRK